MSLTSYCIEGNHVVTYYTVRLAPEEISAKLTGYGHNAVTCIGMKTDIPVNAGSDL